MNVQKINKQKFPQGSALVFTLIVLSVILVAAIGISSVSVIERKTSTSTGKSTSAFQVADSGAEIVLQKIYKGSLNNISDLGLCANGKVTGYLDAGNQKKYEIAFFDTDDGSLQCSDDISDIRKIKSVGDYAGTSRAIEVAVAAIGDYQISCGSKEPGVIFCCRINTSTSSTECKQISSGGGNKWIDVTENANPW